MKIAVIGLLAAISLHPAPIHSLHWSPPVECTTCSGSMSAYNNSPCIAVDWDPVQSIVSGTCQPTTCLQVTGCTLGGSVTISNTGAGGCGDIYVRTRVDGACGGTVTLVPHQEGDTTSYDGVVIRCGTMHQVVIYTNEAQASNCNAAGAAGFSWTCNECKRIG